MILLAVRRRAHAPMLHIPGAIGRALVLVMRGHVCEMRASGGSFTSAEPEL